MVRPFRPDEFDEVVTGRTRLAREALPQGPPDPRMLRDRLLRSGTLDAGTMDLAIEADGSLVGEIQTYMPTDRRLPRGTYELGLALYDPTDRGKGFGTEAVGLLVEWLFGVGAERVQGAAALTNSPMRRVFEKLRFKEGARLDVEGISEVLYVISSDDWSA